MLKTFDPKNIDPSRTLNVSYIVLDCIFLALLTALLIYQKKYLTLIFALFGAILYVIVDFGIFYAALGSRHVTNNFVDKMNNNEFGVSNTFWFLLWLSTSYGMTNFVLIWLALKKDKNLKYYATLIVIWWFCAPLLSEMAPSSQENKIHIWRETGNYHWVMALILVIGYFGAIIYNIISKKEKMPIFRMLAIGILVQFGWELALLVNNIREFKFGPLVIDSLIETNLGIPYIWWIQKVVNKYVSEDFSPRSKIEVLE
ncbi:hypothetical protein [Mycoplasma sp. Mirounga ES2805-ORL]|uniref:hypothetical protein n=1 Tax=Mycoplasma sp. Mirounga ES2805-ORL TaxID=754514 RepID=UPI00197C9B60|nr:hypothetical protein [Mycoplasma sp. Mirounga ES2805-ORL]QSF13659.1 hypothetical protein JXZ90_03260 [Mycoplasma sp. Mirounga ES2805-ORL]